MGITKQTQLDLQGLRYETAPGDERTIQGRIGGGKGACQDCSQGQQPTTDSNVIPFPQHWSVARLVRLNRNLAAFDAKVRTIPGAHPEYADEDCSTRPVSLSLSINPEVSVWFWPQDLQPRVLRLLERLGLTP
jgi:hypothetical protein